ncbi:hypothetical protein FA95DRAFT_1676640 [Auriscalpium vulgare]|uniref:Uncharacterized protein n=1 Tax=Auriscalpium vulgare TaxID=40419 RepID=A0ACB8S3G9_9AGAM|nr:hypothetical protein FA95DRAFT_1676640 [Auriscalpium vulgare]
MRSGSGGYWTTRPNTRPIGVAASTPATSNPPGAFHYQTLLYLHILCHSFHLFYRPPATMSTSSREMRQRTSQFDSKARAGKNPVNPSRKEKLEKQSPVGLWALGLVLFVIVGGVFFELFRIMFL